MTTLDYAKQICYSSEETLEFTYQMAFKQRNINGVYIECGVAAGAQIIAMAAAAPDKTIYAFDSFEGIPLPSNKDDQMPGIRFLTHAERVSLPNPGEQVLESSGATAVNEETFWEHIEKSGVEKKNIKTVPGWFENTVALFGQLHTQIALLRLDGDLYNSTYVCLKHLYKRVVNGGVVIVDDYALEGSRHAVLDFIAEEGMKGIMFHPVNGMNFKDGAYWFKS